MVSDIRNALWPKLSFKLVPGPIVRTLIAPDSDSVIFCAFTVDTSSI